MTNERVERVRVETECCPTCGRPLEAKDAPTFIVALGEVHYRGVIVRLSPVEMDFFELLHEAHPLPVSRDTLLAELYPETEQCGSIISVWVARLRQRFRRAGAQINIVSRAGMGARVGYALVWGDNVNHD